MSQSVPSAAARLHSHPAPRHLTRALLAGAAGLATLGPPVSAAIVKNAASDFSASSNPNGVWSFGSEYPNLGSSPFILESSNGSTYGLDYWATASGPILPGAFHNPTSSTIFYGNSVDVDPGQLVLHPGEFGEYSIARFTAPVAATYTFSADFIGQDYVTGTSPTSISW
ncbi:MAG: hypothetical protein IPJ41_07180 [Phycisphaerales bacterium]|nr:hypothetical protein [Phycisphaerales bacterium]